MTTRLPLLLCPLLTLLLAAPLWAQGDAPPGSGGPSDEDRRLVFEPGQEGVLDPVFSDAEAPYPACTFRGAAYGSELILLPFDCDGNEAQARLRHVDNELEPGVKTVHFTISSDKNLPQAVIDEIKARVEAVEEQVLWVQRRDLVLTGIKGPEQPVELMDAAEHIDAGRYDKGISIILDLLRARPSGSVTQALGNALATVGMTPESAQSWIDRAEMVPDDPALQYAAGTAAFLAADYSENSQAQHEALHATSARYFEAVAGEYLEDIWLQFSLGQSYFVMGRDVEAKARIDKAFQMDTEGMLPQLHLARARILQRQNPTEAAQAVDAYQARIAEMVASFPNTNFDPDELKHWAEVADYLRAGDNEGVDVFFHTRWRDNNPWYYVLDYPLIGLGVALVLFLGYRFFGRRKQA